MGQVRPRSPHRRYPTPSPRIYWGGLAPPRWLALATPLRPGQAEQQKVGSEKAEGGVRESCCRPRTVSARVTGLSKHLHAHEVRSTVDEVRQYPDFPCIMLGMRSPLSGGTGGPGPLAGPARQRSRALLDSSGALAKWPLGDDASAQPQKFAVSPAHATVGHHHLRTVTVSPAWTDMVMRFLWESS
jgi:hypothetical protein